MFWFLAIISMLGYSLQSVLMAKYVREMDAWSAAMYRTLSLGISMLPLLIWAGWEKTAGIVNVWPEVWLASLFGAGGLAMAFSLLHFLPIGITSAISSGVRVAITIVIAWIFFGEALSMPISVLLLVILGATFWLGLIRQSHKEAHLKSYDLYKGVVFVIIQGFLTAMAFILFSDAARQHDPLVVSYFWEMQIGVLLTVIGLIRWVLIKKPLQKISLKNFWWILVACSPTLIGTGAFALAVTNGGAIGIVSAIGVGSIFVTALLALWISKERPLKVEWIGMGIIALGIVGLKLIEL